MKIHKEKSKCCRVNKIEEDQNRTLIKKKNAPALITVK